MKSKLLKGSRLFRLIVFLGFAGCIFVLFQMISLYALNNSDISRSSHTKLIANSLNIKHNSEANGEANMLEECKENKQMCFNRTNRTAVVIQSHDKLLLNEDPVKLLGNALPNRLGNSEKKQDHFVLEENVVKVDSDSMDYDDNNGQGNSREKQRLSSRETGNKLVEKTYDLSKLPRGVPVHLAQYYTNLTGVFVCIETKEEMSFTRVNDDYCDCADSSDEPGSNACPDSRFFCRYQLPTSRDPTWITGSKVNDGLCDCCDGSDEWQNPVLPLAVKLNDDNKHYGIRQAPCSNRCSEFEAEARQLSVIQQQGAHIKQQYLATLNDRRAFSADHKYGIDGAYFMLVEKCFERSSDKYKYTLCPYKQVKQSDGHTDTVIGRGGAWLPGGSRLQMDGGESHQCPGLRRRMSVIVFQCGVNDAILSVQETEVCEYEFQFSTSAAC